MGEAIRKSDDAVLQWVTFQLDNETYGVNVMAVKEVLRFTSIAPVPGAPDYVTGIINIRGTVISVIKTRRRFGLPDAEPGDQTRIVIIEIGRHVIGIVVDSVAEVVYLRQLEIESTPNVGQDESARFIQGVCNRNGELLILAARPMLEPVSAPAATSLNDVLVAAPQLQSTEPRIHLVRRHRGAHAGQPHERGARRREPHHGDARAIDRSRSNARLQRGAVAAERGDRPAAAAAGSLSGPQVQPEFPGFAVAARRHREPGHHRPQRLQPGGAEL